MNKISTTQAIWLAVIPTLLAGSVMTWNTAARMQERHGLYMDKLGFIKELNSLAKEAAPYYNAEKSYRKITARPVPIASFAGNALPDIQHETRPGHESLAIAPGWKLRQQEISFSEAPIDKVMGFAVRAESLNPPWRVAQCEIRASAGRENCADIVLLLEVPEKQDN